MPELPEVETVRTGLNQALSGAVITQVTLRRKDLRIPFPKGFVQKLTGQTIQSVARRAKYLLLHLSCGEVLIAHLGMSGHFSVTPKKPTGFSTHDHVAMQLKDGRCVLYNDPRRFGLMTLCPSKTLAKHALFSSLGPEPLEKEFTAAYLQKALTTRKSPIKTTIMDQALVVGVGNIYASEALFLSKISPTKPAKTAANQSPELVLAIQKVLKSAIASGGSSLRDFLHVSGESGYFQHQFNVYGRAGQPCITCKTPIKAIRQSGRSTFFCPHCQK